MPRAWPPELQRIASDNISDLKPVAVRLMESLTRGLPRAFPRVAQVIGLTPLEGQPHQLTCRRLRSKGIGRLPCAKHLDGKWVFLFQCTKFLSLLAVSPIDETFYIGLSFYHT
jgi:hypothetical protein